MIAAIVVGAAPKRAAARVRERHREQGRLPVNCPRAWTHEADGRETPQSRAFLVDFSLPETSRSSTTLADSKAPNCRR